jgi:uncharacterized protein (DUF58 family)
MGASVAARTLFERIHRIEIVSNQLAKDLLAGAYRSAFKGRGMEFEDVRAYEPGDEIRSIDWNVTARMNAPYVKNFREERDLTVLLVVDVSASCRFGGKNGLKSDLLAEIGAVLAFSAIRNNDRIGLLLFSDQIEKYVPPRKGTRHVLRIIRELLAFRPSFRGSNLKAALDFLGKLPLRTGICFILSDFLFPAMDKKEIALAMFKNDLIAISVNDPTEFQLPPTNLVQLKDLESGHELLIDSKKALSVATKMIETHRRSMHESGADFLAIRTDQAYAPILRTFFRKRKERPR